jgi:farnesyl-diphosphate farnesyltransferase
MVTALERALDMLGQTSRTFLIPIQRLPPGLIEAVGSAYLCMRAIDEIEDHPSLDCPTKEELLRNISQTLQSSVEEIQEDNLLIRMSGYRESLPEVTVQLVEWARLAPRDIAPRIWDATASMADRMADWAGCCWNISNQADLDCYTFGVAGAVGLILSDLWAWYDGTKTDRTLAIGFGRGLQAVNIIRNHPEDLMRGVDFYPPGWDDAALQAYARQNLAKASAYVQALPAGPALDFCEIPLILAYGTLDALEQGKIKLERSDVLRLLAESARN